jgi:prepilin-type N-terminal cleavage/methylation domain-containing protein
VIASQPLYSPQSSREFPFQRETLRGTGKAKVHMHKSLKSRQRGSEGFSLLEMLVVVAIILIISAMAIPNVVNSLGNVRMRSTGTEIASPFEQARMEAIKRNANGLQVRNYVDANGRTIFYIDLNGSKSFTANEPMVMLPQGYSVPNAPPAGLNLKYPGNVAPLVLGAETEGTTAAPIVGFNSRGLPCTGNPCNSMTSQLAGTNFATYFTDGRRTGAIAVYQTGKIKVYLYDGTRYQ